MKDLIKLDNLVKSYKTDAGEFLALKNINLNITKGEFVGVIGKSGSGKSTLINMITAIDKPSSGEVYVADTPVHTLNENEASAFRGKNLGIVFQFFQLLPNLSVIDNVILPMDFSSFLTPKKRLERAKLLLDMVELEGQYHKLPSQLSGGQQQRVAIARALANDPPILFADEPTGNLDSKTSEKIFSLFEDLVNQNKTILMVTHDEDQAKRVNRSIIISDGEIIEEFLATAFPALTEADLVWITSKLKHKTYTRGQTIIQKDQPVDSLFIVTKGTVEIVLQVNGMSEMIVAEFERGDYFGEIELLRQSKSVATVRASLKGDVEVAAISKPDFISLTQKSTSTKKQIDKIAKLRFKENISKTKSK